MEGADDAMSAVVKLLSDFARDAAELEAICKTKAPGTGTLMDTLMSKMTVVATLLKEAKSILLSFPQKVPQHASEDNIA
ncbi:hypothetical protein Pelo_12979 [Pelomyxa schiedti]|nr:hypothetical protein Pelo_12979 [Pelomyxa schiedti]